MGKPAAKKSAARPQAKRMGAMMSKAPTADAYEKELTPANRKVVRALRVFVHKVAPELRERMMWGGVAFIGEGNVCFAHALETHVDFGFFRGSELHDTEKLLKGNGKFVRTVSIARVSEIKEKEFARLIKEAMALPQ